MGYGMSFNSTIPINYQNNLYWQYLMQTMQNTQNAYQSLYANQQLTQQAQQSPQYTQQDIAETQELALQQQELNEAQNALIQAKKQDGDGNDDGNISFGEKCKNFAKGVGKFFTGMFCDDKGKFSLSQTVKTIAVGAAAVGLCVATGGAATPFLVAGGIGLGTVQTGKGIFKACTATTDAEAKAAWQEIGSGATAIAGSIAGAKGALKASGNAIPKGNAITSALKATKDCVQIAFTQGIKGGKFALTHPIKAAQNVATYWNNTAKPNLLKGLSFKTAHKNYTQANEKQFNNQIEKYNEQITKLTEEAKTATSERANAIQQEIMQLEDKKFIAEMNSLTNNSKQKTLDILEQKITQIESKLQNNKLTNKEKLILEKQRNNYYDAANKIDSNYNRLANKSIAAKENYINSLKDKLKKATEGTKATLESEIKVQETILKQYKQQQKIEIAQHNIQKADALTTRLKDQLRKASTNAEKEAINARIEYIQKAISSDKNVLRLANMKLAAKQTLQNVGIASGAYYLATQSSDRNYYTPSTADALAQENGFATANEMQAEIDKIQQYINAMQSSQQALNNANQVIQQTTNQNPYMTNLFNQMQMPMGNMLGFNELYVSPYGEYI